MATKLQYYSAVADQTLSELTAGRGNWMGFLDTAARLYKYPFTDQMMIYAQRPNATACLELEQWNEHFNRWVRRGAKGIALIDDSGSYPRLRYVFDVSDTEPSLYRAKPVQMWEMAQEHKTPVLAALAQVYEDVGDSLGESFRNIAKQLASEYYEDNAREIGYRSENSTLEPPAAYDFAGTLIEQSDDTALRAAFESALSASVAYMVMSRCTLEPSAYFDAEDFQVALDFNTPDMINALGVAASDLSEQVLREIELVIRKYERVKNVERSIQNERGTDLHTGGRLPAAEHHTERAAEGGNSAAGPVRENAESVSERTQGDNLQPLAVERGAVPASAGSGRGSDSENGTDDARADLEEQPAGQGGGFDGVDGFNERVEGAGRGNGGQRTDLQLNENETSGAADEAAPFTLSMADTAQLHVDLNERLIDAVTSDVTVLNAAVNSDKENTLDEITAVIDRVHTEMSIAIAESNVRTQSGMVAELERYFEKDRQPPIAQQLYDAVMRSDAYREHVTAQAGREAQNEPKTAKAEETAESNDTIPGSTALSQVGIKSLEELLSTSAVTLAEVDSVLRDGGNERKSVLRIAARFAKDKPQEALAAFLRREYLRGRYSRTESESGKGFDFGTQRHHICAWFDESGIQLAVGVTAKNNIHKITIPWETAAERVNQLMHNGQYISADVFAEALDNEKQELAERLWHFYRDDMREMPKAWDAGRGGFPNDVAVIKGLLSDFAPRHAILRRLEADVPISKTMERSHRAYHDADMLLADMREAILPPKTFPHAAFRDTKDFACFLTEDEIDAFFTRGGSTQESKFRIMSYFLGDHTPKEKADFLKNEYGYGGGTWSATDGWHNAEPGKGITLSRGGIGTPAAEVNFKWPAAAKRIETLISEGRYMTHAGLDYLPNYERLMLVRGINHFYSGLPEEYERPFDGTTGLYANEYRDENGEKALDFSYPREAEWAAISGLLDNSDNLNALIARMEPIIAHTSEEDRYYSSRKTAWDHINAYRDGAYTLFPGIERLPEPGAFTARRFNEPRRETVIDLNDRNHNEGSQTGEQLSLDGLFPVLPSVTAQQTKINDTLEQDAALADEPFLNISDENKARIAAQFTTNPRSREAVTLVREIYGNTLSMPIPQAMQHIAGLASEGRFEASDYHRLPGLRECERLKHEHGGAVVFYQNDGLYEMYHADAALASEVFEIPFILINNGFPKPVPTCFIAPATLDASLDALNHLGHDVVVSADLEDGSRRVDIRLSTKPEVDIEPEIISEPEQPLDFDAVAQTALERVMADTDYSEALASAKSRASLRNPCTWALEQSIRDHEADEPRIYNAYFSDDDFNDNLFDFVLKQSWAQRPEPEAEVAPQEIFGNVTDITDPDAFVEIEAVFGDTKEPKQVVEPQTSYIVGQRVVLDLREKLRGTLMPDAPHNAGEFIIDSINGDTVAVSMNYKTDGASAFGSQGSQNGKFSTFLTSAEVAQYTVPPVANKLHEELSPSGNDTTAYYLLQYPNGIDAGAVLNHEALTLITDKADSYIICAEACFLSDAELTKWNIGFRKMPRDWHMLPENVQAKIRDARPAYELQWQEMYNEPEQKAEIAVTPAQNFRITNDHLGEGGAKTKFRYNADAIALLHDLEFDKRNATPEEQEILSRYVGWGGLPQAFDPDNKQWENEYLELNALLSPEEWESAQASTLNAHYTSPAIIKGIWETVERLGFRSGNVLEPSCGVGNFFGLIPESMANAKLYGVELDSVTARIAKHLYPNADIQQTGFENTDFSDSFFDLAIGNVPFGDYGVADKRYDKHKFSIHDYFFGKTLDQVRPGGIVCFLTSKFTLDKQNSEVRKYIAQRAELLGAVRLPNNAFLKNAGTETAMDLLILQKRDRQIDIAPEWVHIGLTDDDIPVNRYYLDNPEMVLGTMALDERMNNKYGRDDYTTCLPIESTPDNPAPSLAEQLKTALLYVNGQYTIEELDDFDGVGNHAIPADSNVKNFSYSLVAIDKDGNAVAAKDSDGTVYFRENSLMYPVDLPMTTLERIKGMIGLRDCVQTLIALQLDEHSDEEIKAQQAVLNDLYDSFIAEFGLINATANSRAFNADSSYYLLSSLEILDEDGGLARKADMFSKRTIKQKTVITHADTASEALAVSIGEKARVDLAFMSELTGKSHEALINELQGIIFLNIGSADSPEKAYVTADEYLSGNVRDKLRLAEAAAVAAPALHVNVEALKAVQPKDLEAGEIAVRLGATWIAPAYVEQFMHGLLRTSNYNKNIYKVNFHTHTGEWNVSGKGKTQFSDINATVTYGTGRMNAYQIIDDTLNLRDVRVYDYKEDADGREQRVLNKRETTLAQQKQELIKQEFKDWIWNDPERRQMLVREYNERFNSIRPREFDGSHIVFSGISPEITLRPHQSNAIAHILYGGNTLLAHEVGAGKTFEMVGAAMESKRLGLCQKSLFAVPNHLTEQWAGEFLRLYPSANILVASKKDFEMRNRKKFCAKIATGDYDAVIIGHSQLEKIPMSKERQTRILNEQIWETVAGMEELKKNNGERFSIKQLAKTKKSLEVRLKKLNDSKTRDDVVTFEQLGVDRLFVDESHNFKNLFLHTKMRNVAGLSTSEAQKSSDLFMKCRYMDELTGGKGIVFATGTPISNSMSEMYTIQRYLQYDALEAKNLTHFDAWASIFGETVTSIELAPEGTGYRARTRFARFHNLPELMAMFKEVADIQTADTLDLPVPKANYKNIIVEPSDIQRELVEELSERAAAVHRKEVPPESDNMLKITTDGRKIGLDQRLINPILPDFEGSKVNACADNVHEIWNATKDERLTQLVFCDFSTPKANKFNVYDDIRSKLLAKGIPEDEIAFIHNANTEMQKKELFAKVRQGKIRVLFGSTFKMGAGTNCQDRLIAIHDADCPWRPSDLAQRAGRIVRQGNMNPEVDIYRYATNGTFDSYLWQTVEKKQQFIAQIMTSKSPVRSCEDCDETALSYAEIKALCAGNPLIAEKMNLDNEVSKLRMLKSEHQSQHYRLEDALLKHYPQQITALTGRIAGIEKDIVSYTDEREKCVIVQTLDGAASASASFPGMTINGTKYSEKEPAAKALIDACKGIMNKSEELLIGEYMGFKMGLTYASFGEQIKLNLRGTMTYQIDLSTDTFGNITRINNALEGLPAKLEGAKESLAETQAQQTAAKLELERPFTKEVELSEMEARLALLNADLNIDGDGGFDVMNDTDDRRETSESQDYKEEAVEYFDEDEVDSEYEYEPERVAVYAKARPSILESLHNYNSNKKAPEQNGGKSNEISI